MVDVYFDTETTGTDYKKHSIIQLSGIIEKNGEIVKRFDYNIKPHPKARIEPEALAANGHREEDFKDYMDMEFAHKRLISILTPHVDRYNPKDKAWLIGYNNRAFDDFFLRKFFELCGDKYIGSWFWNDTIDVLVLASHKLKSQRQHLKNFKLKTVAEFLGVKVDPAMLHDSGYDAHITREVYKILTAENFCADLL